MLMHKCTCSQYWLSQCTVAGSLNSYSLTRTVYSNETPWNVLRLRGLSIIARAMVTRNWGWARAGAHNHGDDAEVHSAKHDDGHADRQRYAHRDLGCQHCGHAAQQHQVRKDAARALSPSLRGALPEEMPECTLKQTQVVCCARSTAVLMQPYAHPQTCWPGHRP